MSIPKIFHQIWLGGAELPAPYQALRDHMLQLHPGWEYRLWTDDNLPPLINHRLFDAQLKFMYKSDVLRYEILAEHGGVYIDTDFLLYKNLEPLLRNTDHFLAYEMVDWVCNSVMGFAPNHWFLWKLITEGPPRARALWDHMGVDRIGPGLITACAKQSPNLLILPRNVFYPLSAHEVRDRQFDHFPGAYGAHLWNSMTDLEALQVWRTLPAAKKYDPREWTLDELKAMAANAPKKSPHENLIPAAHASESRNDDN
jgi:hypothetical protein